MALTRTTTSASVKATDILIPVTNTASGFPAIGQILNGSGQWMLVDQEAMSIVQVVSAGLVLVRNRGSDGTIVSAHDINAPVVTSSVITDFPSIPTGMLTIHPQEYPDVVAYGQSGAIAVPIKDTKVSLTGTAIQAMTLGAPGAASKSIELFITSEGPFAHTVSAPSLFDNGAAGSPFSTMTFPAQPGASVLLMGQFNNTLQALVWNVVAINGAVTFS